ncbi:MAG: aldo/keto reductase [Terracidiphilus sp.]
MALGEFVKRWAVREQSAPAQIALSWLMVQESWIVPIPGTTKMPHFLDNIGVNAVQLTPDEVKELNAVLARTPVHGARLPAIVMSLYCVEAPPKSQEAKRCITNNGKMAGFSA